MNSIILDDTKKVKIFGEIIDKIKESGMSLETNPYFRFHLVALGMIAVNGGHVYFPKVLRSIVQKHIVQGLLLKDVRTELEIETLQNLENEKEATDINLIYEHLSEEVKTKVEGIKLLVRWIYGLKLNTILGMFQQNVIRYIFKMLFLFSVVPESQEEANSTFKMFIMIDFVY